MRFLLVAVKLDPEASAPQLSGGLKRRLLLARRDLRQRGAAAVVSEEDGALQERQHPELPHQVRAGGRRGPAATVENRLSKRFCWELELC